MANSELATSTTIPTLDRLSGLADPVVTANVYCSGLLDHLISGAVNDFWQSSRRIDGHDLCYLWFVRYRCGGDHVKLRIHGPAQLASALKQELAQTLDRYLARLPPSSPVSEADRRSDAPPIDLEDRTPEGHPDRSVLWTRYERSHISLGGGPLLHDEVYLDCLTRFWGLCTARLLAELELDESGVVPHRQRQNLMMKILIGALADLDFTEERRTDYLRHHRDWLIRFALRRALDRAMRARELVQRFQEQIAGMGEGVSPITRTLERFWNTAAISSSDSAAESPLRRLADHLDGFRGNPAYHLDPFTIEPAFTGLFKALHGVANQLGLSLTDEAMTFHLLLQLRSPLKAASEVRLVPT